MNLNSMLSGYGKFIIIALVFSLFSCQKAYYGTMEKFGVHKRDILVDRVEDARDSQEEAKEQFQSALDRFKSVTGFEGGDLEEKYDILNTEFQQCEDNAKAVHERIDSVDSVAKALFDEWADELDQYTSDSLKESSRRQLEDTQRHYTQLLKAMKRAEAKIDPVLDAFRDQVLFLKHNLNARAIASLKSELGVIETDVARLIRDMEAAIKEADGFISALAG